MTTIAIDDLPTTIETQEDADRTLKRFNSAERTRSFLANKRDEEIAEVREEYRPHLDGLDQTRRTLSARLEKWSRSQLPAWREQKRESLDLTHGRVGFRAPSSNAIKLPRRRDDRKALEDRLLPKLEELEMDHCIVVDKSVNWKALEHEDDSTLEVLGLKRNVGKSKFYTEAHKEKESRPFLEPSANESSSEGVA